MRPISAPHPAARFRRLRSSAPLRALAQENTLSVNDLIWPVFVCDGQGVTQTIASMPGVVRALAFPQFACFPTPAPR